MKQILPVLFLLFLFPIFSSLVYAVVSFGISNPTKEGDYYIVDASISGISSSSAYVQGMFTATGSTTYFGYTWGQNEEWVNYVSNTNKDFITLNLPILQRNVTQKIWVRPNYSDSAYKGPGDYLLKLKRYTGASDNSTGEDAVLTVTLTEPLPTPIPTVTTEITSTPNPTSEITWTPYPTKTPSPTSTKTPTKTLSPSPTSSLRGVSTEESDDAAISAIGSSSAVLSYSTNLATIAAIPDQSVKNQPETRQSKAIIFFGVGLVLCSGGLLYLRLKRS